MHHPCDFDFTSCAAIPHFLILKATNSLFLLLLALWLCFLALVFIGDGSLDAGLILSGIDLCPELTSPGSVPLFSFLRQIQLWMRSSTVYYSQTPL